MLEGRGDGSCLGLKGWKDNERGVGQVSVSCKLTAVFIEISCALHFSSRGECQQFRCNSLYLLPSTDNFISWTTRKSDEAGPSPHNILEYIV